MWKTGVQRVKENTDVLLSHWNLGIVKTFGFLLFLNKNVKTFKVEKLYLKL